MQGWLSRKQDTRSMLQISHAEQEMLTKSVPLGRRGRIGHFGTY